MNGSSNRSYKEFSNKDRRNIHSGCTFKAGGENVKERGRSVHKSRESGENRRISLGDFV